MEEKKTLNSELPAQAAGEFVPSQSAAAKVPAREDTKNQRNGYWKNQWKGIKKYRKLILFLVPAAAFSLIFSYIPMLGILFAFKGPEFNLAAGDVLFNLTHGSWTFQNFANIFVDPKIGLAIGNTLLINIIRLLLCFPLSIIIAVMLSELKSQTLSKTILIILTIPNFLSWVIVIGIWSGFLDPDTGFLGQALADMGAVNIMADNGWFKPLVVVLSAWKGAGWGCILFYSAIVSIDKTYYESATLEGANRLQKTWYLTIPSILPTIALMLVLNISGMMAVGFEQVYTMMKQNTSLIDSQITLDTYLYEISIVKPSDIPFATSLGVLNGLIALVLMLVGNKITSKTLKRGLW